MMKRRRRRRVLFVFEILILLLLVGGIFVYAQVNNKLNKIQTGDVDMGEAVSYTHLEKITMGKLIGNLIIIAGIIIYTI